MAKNYVWSYQVRERGGGSYPITAGHIVLPTSCGVTAATEIVKRYDAEVCVIFLNLLGKVDE